MMQLKVRYKSTILSLIESEMPSELLTKFFISLTNDENYFYESFLYPCEIKSMEFTDLGATMNMVATNPDPDPDPNRMGTDSDEVRAFEELADANSVDNGIGKLNVDDVTVQDIDLKLYTRVRMLLMNFIFLR